MLKWSAVNHSLPKILTQKITTTIEISIVKEITVTKKIIITLNVFQSKWNLSKQPSHNKYHNSTSQDYFSMKLQLQQWLQLKHKNIRKFSWIPAHLQLIIHFLWTILLTSRIINNLQIISPIIWKIISNMHL